MTSLRTSLSTITSLDLSEVVLELGKALSEFTQPFPNLWGNWYEIEKLFEGFLDLYPDFKLLFRTGRLSNRDKFLAQAKERFPLMAMRDSIQLETSLDVDKYWSECSPPRFTPARHPKNPQANSII